MIVGVVREPRLGRGLSRGLGKATAIRGGQAGQERGSGSLGVSKVAMWRLERGPLETTAIPKLTKLVEKYED
ncbi:MAG: hypothetical protein QW290_04380 [Sulfolobales archaeon]